MKNIILVLTLAIPLVVFGQDDRVKYFGDSLFITDEGITNNFLDFGNDPLAKIKGVYNPKYTVKTFFNRHVDGAIDTVFTFYIKDSEIEIYKVHSENFVTSARIQSENIKTRVGFTIGMDKLKFIDLMKSFELNYIPDYVKLFNSEIEESIVN